MKIVIHYTRKSATIACAMILIVIGGTIVFSRGNDSRTAPPRIASSPANAPAQQTDEGPVDVTATHDEKQSTEQTHIFTVVLDTHSGDLSTFDAQTNIVYRPTNGSESRPTTIGGDRESHHRTIVVTFTNTTFPGIIAVKNLRSVPERIVPITL